MKSEYVLLIMQKYHTADRTIPGSWHWDKTGFISLFSAKIGSYHNRVWNEHPPSTKWESGCKIKICQLQYHGTFDNLILPTTENIYCDSNASHVRLYRIICQKWRKKYGAYRYFTIELVNFGPCHTSNPRGNFFYYISKLKPFLHVSQQFTGL